MAWQDRPYYRDGGAPRIRMSVPMPTPMTMVVMAICLAIFLIDAFSGHSISRWTFFTFYDGLATRQPWRWITYQYVHGSGSHIFWNLLGIYFFLPPLERFWGWKRAFTFYTAGGVVACLFFGMLEFWLPATTMVGASGSIFAAVGACAYLFPEMSLLFIPIRVGAALWAILFLLQIAGEKDLAQAAHLGGLAVGFFAPYYGARTWHKIQRQIHLSKARQALSQERADDELVDHILQKVHDTGMNSLTRWERKALKKATERQRISEVARGRRG